MTSPTTETVRPRVAWHGEASLYGVMTGIGLLATAFLGVQAALVPFLGPVLGLVLMTRRDRRRQFGVGLLASGLVVPSVLGSFWLVQLLDLAL